MKFVGKTITTDTTIYDAFKARAEAGVSLVVVDEEFKLLGTLSDGDLRKAILTKNNLSDSISKIYNSSPIVIDENKYSKNFAKNPPSGGIPAKEKNSIKKEKANIGFSFESPERSSIFSVYFSSAFIKYKQANVPKFITI